MENAQLKASVANLLSGAGISAGGIEVQPVDGGGNNKVFSVYTQGATYLVKLYYSDSNDQRDRLGSEYSFLSYAQKIGLDSVPRPICRNPEKNMALYEFVEGRKLSASELTDRHIMQAAGFIRELNARPDRDQYLPIASEGCFSIEQHFSLIDGRLQRLHGIPIDSDIDRQARSLVDELQAAWAEHKNKIAARVDSLSAKLDIADRCISPSDFGFHNALLRAGGEICFIDFEYAGWDDPAKMVNDFFLQPAVPVPFEYYDLFVEEALSYSRGAHVLMNRARLLFPVFRIKWCCIMLNEFLPDVAKRRSFAISDENPDIRKSRQLDKMRFYLEKAIC